MTETLAYSASAVRDYVTQVRVALADLSPEDVDDLTGGLEADLGEHLAERPLDSDLTTILGTPQTYAAELRAAAGLPTAPAPARISLSWQATAALRNLGARLLARFPWLADLRTPWWLARGFVLGVVMSAVLLSASRQAEVLVGVVGAALSFAWGRRSVARGPRRPLAFGLVTAVNIVAVLALVPVAFMMTGPDVQYVSDTPQPASSGPGVWVNSEPATNLYAFDAKGNRIDNVRLFNQYGQAVTVDPNALLGIFGPGQEPPMDDQGNPQVNLGVFPLRWGLLTGWQASSGGWEPPIQISPLSDAQTATPAPGGTPSATNAPSATGSSSVTSAPSAATKGTPSPGSTP